jgi:DNA replication protein DnaC
MVEESENYEKALEDPREKFYFLDTSDIDGVLGESASSAQDAAELHGGQSSEDTKKGVVLAKLRERLRRVETAMELFPLRHRKNLHDCLRNGHPLWMTKFNSLRENFGTGSIFALLGPRGTGKTQMATALARYVAENVDRSSCRPVFYVVLADLFAAIKATFKPETTFTEEDILRDLESPALLVVDEAHEMSGTEWQSRVLTLLVDRRYRNLRDTLLIANENGSRFVDAVGPSIAGRMDECGFIVNCDWESFRGAPKESDRGAL